MREQVNEHKQTSGNAKQPCDEILAHEILRNDWLVNERTFRAALCLASVVPHGGWRGSDVSFAMGNAAHAKCKQR
jgi:hypothetical protein